MAAPVRVIRAGSPEAKAAAEAGLYVYVGRPSQWGNPFRISRDVSRAKAIDHFRVWWYADINIPMRQHALETIKPGSLLGCYCHPKPCHGDVIAEFLNRHRAL